MPHYMGSCKCRAVSLAVFLPVSIENYEPRKCDCDFCVTHNLSYISDPKGKLTVQFDGKLANQKQGSEQATFLTCNNCETIVAAVCEFEGKLRGAINSNLLDNNNKLMKPISVSPKKLSPSEKVKRWEEVWFHVSVNTK